MKKLDSRHIFCDLVWLIYRCATSLFCIVVFLIDWFVILFMTQWWSVQTTCTSDMFALCSFEVKLSFIISKWQTQDQRQLLYPELVNDVVASLRSKERTKYKLMLHEQSHKMQVAFDRVITTHMGFIQLCSSRLQTKGEETVFLDTFQSASCIFPLCES